MTQPLTVQIASSHAKIVFDRPQALNAINQDCARAFEEAIKQVLKAGVRVVTLSGNGRSFMAGGDLAAFRDTDDRAAEAEAIIAPMNAALSNLAASDILSIALVQGPVAGAGVSLALATDFALAADTSSLNFAYLKIGAPADCGITWTLPRHVGLRRAAWIAIEGGTVSAAQALEWGLFNRLVPAEDLQAEGDKLATRLAGMAPGAVASLRQLLRNSFGHDFTTALEAEKQAFKKAAATDDFAEAISAFFDKRPAQFRGK